MTEQHTHEIDAKLHDECPACDLIRSVSAEAKRYKQADDNAKHFARIADKVK